jgi:hypothetical protein
MLDISHYWGEDLGIGPTGDLGLAAGSPQVQQRILRRLLTNPGDYIWEIGYGAGLSAFVGGTATGSEVGAIIRSQLLKESSVASSPEPLVFIADQNDQAPGRFMVTVEYVDATDLTTSVMAVPVSR